MKRLIVLSCLLTTPVLSVEFNLVEQVNRLKIERSQFFNGRSQHLASAIAGYCERADFSVEQSDIQQHWRETMQAWMPMQGVTKGPIIDLDLSWSVQFWPDKKNITGRKIEQLLQSQQDNLAQTKWNAQQISEQSVAVRGLGALELLIFEQQLSAKNCLLTTAIAQHLADNSQEITDTWSDQYAPKLLQQSKLKTQRKSIELGLVAELSHQLSFINKKLAMPMGKGLSDEHTRPYQAEAWRSESSMLMLKASYQSLQSYFLKAVKPLLIQENQDYLASRIEGTFKQLLMSWPAEVSLKKLLSDKSGLKKLYRSKMSMDTLSYQLQEELPIALNIVVGFNATDGD